MIAAIEYWDKVSYTTSASEIKRTENWEDTKEGIFKKFDKQNNRLRYCNGSYFKFEDETTSKGNAAMLQMGFSFFIY